MVTRYCVAISLALLALALSTVTGLLPASLTPVASLAALGFVAYLNSPAQRERRARSGGQAATTGSPLPKR